MSWIPNHEERGYIKLVTGMAIDTDLNKGVADRQTFVANLRTIADQLEQLPVAEEPRRD